MAESASRSLAQPGIVLGLTFLVVGLTFAFPHRLVPAGTYADQFSPEVANVYAFVAWIGWAHFIFAFRGQDISLRRDPPRSRWTYWSLVVATVAILAGIRAWAGVTLFGAVVWVYFIDHFLKAEQHFEGTPCGASLPRWIASYQPLLSFTWLSIVLLDVGKITSQPWLIWGISLGLGVMVLTLGGWRRLASGQVRSPLMSLFFIAEALVWGAFARYGGPMFLTGVYVFHIAAGSYFHYFGGYFFAHSSRRGLSLWAMLGVNIGVVAMGYAVAYAPAMSWLVPILGTQWFTLWVAVHLVTSDLFPAVKNLLSQKLSERSGI